jgi:hypothetical protein
MKTLLKIAFAWGLMASTAFAAQPVTITDSSGNPVNVTSNALNVTLSTGSVSIGVLNAASHAQTSSLASSVVAKSSAGTLYSFSVVADSTLNASAWYVLIFDATSFPANGAVTPAKCYYVPQGQSTLGGTFAAGGSAFTTGIVVGVSTTGCFTLTSSAHAFISADYI